MDDELPAEGGALTPAESATDWEQRYKDTHANWNSLNERMSRFEKDPNALIEFIQEKHPDLLADEDEEEIPQDPYEPDEDEQPLTRAEWKAWQAEQAQAAKASAASSQFESDFKEFVGDRTLDPQGEAFVRYAATKGDIKGPDDLKQTIDSWFTYIDGKAPRAKPRVPHIPANGQAATEVPDWSGMTRAERDKYMAERAQGLMQQ